MLCKFDRNSVIVHKRVHKVPRSNRRKTLLHSGVILCKLVSNFCKYMYVHKNSQLDKCQKHAYIINAWICFNYTVVWLMELNLLLITAVIILRLAVG